MKKENNKSTNLSEDIFSSLPTTNKQIIRRGKTDVCIEAGTFIETDIELFFKTTDDVVSQFVFMGTHDRRKFPGFGGRIAVAYPVDRDR